MPGGSGSSMAPASEHWLSAPTLGVIVGSKERNSANTGQKPGHP
ncbi:MAG: hypothetical protein QM820_55730 [Minicystis sp.]